jgi:hypothetical protein
MERTWSENDNMDSGKATLRARLFAASARANDHPRALHWRPPIVGFEEIQMEKRHPKPSVQELSAELDTLRGEYRDLQEVNIALEHRVKDATSRFTYKNREIERLRTTLEQFENRLWWLVNDSPFLINFDPNEVLEYIDEQL